MPQAFGQKCRSRPSPPPRPSRRLQEEAPYHAPSVACPSWRQRPPAPGLRELPSAAPCRAAAAVGEVGPHS
jgi:hypothetical protein